jgi:putative endonuclease
MITVYVLKGKSGKRYVGITNNLPRRLSEHRAKKLKGSQAIGDFKVLYTETCQDYSAARTKEKFFKSGQGRKWLNELEADLVSEPAIGG